jgi:hypothetical protein
MSYIVDEGFHTFNIFYLIMSADGTVQEKNCCLQFNLIEETKVQFHSFIHYFLAYCITVLTETQCQEIRKYYSQCLAT